jgi:hypothetical protein
MDRQDLLNTLSEAMAHRVDEDRWSGLLKTGRVKSRLLEAHPPEASPDGITALLEALVAESGLKVESLSEDLWGLVSNDDIFFLDGLNPRFWVLHSTAQSRKLQQLVRRYLLTSPRVDSAWFSSSHLDELEGERRWIKSSFSSDALQPDDTGEFVPRRWKAQVEIDNPDDLLELLTANERYRASAVLTAVGTILRDPKLGRADVAADYQGSFIATGDSFHLVAGLLWRTLDRYEAYVRELEASFQLGTHATEEMGLEISGDVAFIELAHPIENLDAMIANLFASKEPFRLWAVPRQVGTDQWEANAVDLHVGHPLRLEITPRWIRVLLTEHTCGNTLARLVANLQHRFDARTHVPAPLPA